MRWEESINLIHLHIDLKNKFWARLEGLDWLAEESECSANCSGVVTNNCHTGLSDVSSQQYRLPSFLSISSSKRVPSLSCPFFFFS